MTQTISVTEVARNFSDYVNRVAYRGESFVLTRGGKPVAEMGPAKPDRPVGLTSEEAIAALRSLPRLDPDDAEAYARDVEEGRRWLNSLPVRDKWES